MSHRVTTQSQIKNKDLAVQAFKAAGLTASAVGPTKFEVRAGRSVGVLDLDTGVIAGDTDRWSENDFDGLRQHYAEASYVAELRRTGASIQERTVDKEGNIVIVYQTTA